MAAQGRPLVENLERQIDAMLARRPEFTMRKRSIRGLAVTEENVRRLFGMSLWELFELLAAKFGFEIEGEAPPKTG
jgi:hypothetical protein